MAEPVILEAVRTPFRAVAAARCAGYAPINYSPTRCAVSWIGRMWTRNE